jgi:hypothetical protein
MTNETVTLLFLAHLKWHHVWQRPQQLMTRFARRYRVIYVDPPALLEEIKEPELHEFGFDQGVQVLQPRFPADVGERSDTYWRMWLGMLPSVLRQAGSHIVLWVSSPYVDQLLEHAKPHIQLAVYDCMDDLASFKDGGAEMRVLEEHLLGLVDLVFTGGHSMYQARKDRHPRVHCFPSGVDIEHYQQVQRTETPIATQIASIPHPQLGYFGVLDERIDWELIREVAARKPEWHWVLVGPTAKVEPEALPKASNIHYLGKQAYSDLPGFLKGFDIATMPFALNEATRFISPTKTLEYLAGDKWVISTSVPDVVAFYSEIVAIADGADAWIATIEASLAAPTGELQARLERARPVLEASTWDAIAARMADLVDEQLAGR